MAKYCSTKYNRTYVEIPVNPVNEEVKSNNMIFCVDVSGSMGGAPINAVNTVLKSIYAQSNINYPLWCYDTMVYEKTIDSVNHTPLQGGGGTDFSCVFAAILKYLETNTDPITFIFMTDGQDGNAHNTTIRMNEINMFKSALTYQMIVHVIGFGVGVNSVFLETVQQLGNAPGLFKFAANTAELETSFSDMFSLSSTSRDVKVNVKGQEYIITSSKLDSVVSLLVDQALTNNDTLTVSYDDTHQTLILSQLESVTPMQQTKMINLFMPKNEAEVRDAVKELNSIPLYGETLEDRLAHEGMINEIRTRMTKYLNIYSKIKTNQVDNTIKLQLQALKYESTFANQRESDRLAARANKNTDYFKKTDLTGKLKKFITDLNEKPEVWSEIKDIADNWVCSYSKYTVYQNMRNTVDDFMCIGILVERNEDSVRFPEKGLKLLSVSNTIISYQSFITALKTHGTNSHGDFSSVNDTLCLTGQSREKFNAVIPLYIHEEHMKRIRILEGIWSGYLYTLNSLGYDKRQEIGLLKLLFDMILMMKDTEYDRRIIKEVEKMCAFIVNTSEGFKTAFGSTTYDQFKSDPVFRTNNQTVDLTIITMVGMLKNDLPNIILPVYYEYCKRNPRQKLDDLTLKQLLYGNGDTVIAVKTNDMNSNDFNNEDYVERSYREFFIDNKKSPIPLVPEISTQTQRKQIVEPDVNLIQSLMQPFPKFLTTITNYVGMGTLDTATTIPMNAETIRKELLMTLKYGCVATYSNVLTLADDLIQGPSKNAIIYEYSPENVAIVVAKMLNTKSLEAYGGLMLKYCPRRNGFIFDATVNGILLGCEMGREKLISLLENKISNTTLYTNSLEFNSVWQPLVPLSKIIEIVGEDKFREIEKVHITNRKIAYHTYRVGNQLNIPDGIYTPDQLARIKAKVEARAYDSPVMKHIIESLKVGAMKNRQGHSNHNPSYSLWNYFTGYVDKF